jgi:hypothetical protein
MVAMIKALVLVAATLSEHWVCGNLVEPEKYNIFLYDFEIEGDELVQKVPGGAGETLRLRILRNDDRRIIFEWLPPSWPTRTLGVRAVFGPSFKIYPEGKISADGNVEGKPSIEGTCEMFR